jgi:DNA-binding transcriptional ArsR family regulator
MTASALETTLAALADPTRRGVIDLLRREPRRAGEIASAFGMTAPAMSRHLRVLRRSGLVEEQSLDDDARVRVYRLRREPFAELRSWIDEIESFWTLQLDSFKKHAERTRKKRSQ